MMRQPDDISDDEQAYWEDLIEEAGLFDNHKNPGKNCIHAMPAGQIPMCAKSGMLCDEDLRKNKCMDRHH